jgi:hypothetical protein
MLRVLVKHALAGAFDEDEVAILTRAFDEAWKAVGESEVCFTSDTYKHAMSTPEQNYVSGPE